jgi:hypothetical protein
VKNCSHRILTNVRLWDTTGTKIRPFDVGECTSCGTTKASRKYKFQELTKEPGVFNHTPYSDRRRALGLR